MLNPRLRQVILTVAILFAGLAGAHAAEGFDLRRFLAPFHSVVLHFPIGFVTLAAILELWSFRNRSAELRKVILLVLGLGAASAVVAAALGWFRAAGGGYDAGALDRHRWFGIGVTALSVFCFITLLLAHDGESGRRFLIGVHRIALAGCVVTLMIAGHQGGNLTHGSNYLLEGAPTFIKAMLAEETFDAVETVPVDERQRYFAEQVRPIFEAKCYSCHGAEKQRGDYRLDDPEIARKGGESGEVAIKPGDPLGSYLVKLILLPPDHDDVMPPSGKLALSAEEIGRVIQWIKNGAVFVEKSAGTLPADPTAP
jgi:uncharacterized membrane protein/mono/diheme cytochrome c family protein